MALSQHWPAIALGVLMIVLVVALALVVGARHRQERRKRQDSRAAVEESLRRIRED